ncbi:beta strand repeat-containing protein [Microbulbifer sp. CnH-101-E]|uniref:beta strand repeat-containing protein n=1 Tax=unclassified Microbulbifer TaxID=2619833 RepID=UPI0040392F4B
MKAKKNTLELKKLTSAIKVSRLAYAGMFAGLLSPLTHAGPEGGVVTGGSGTIDVNGTTTTIDQNTDLLSIDWDSFNLSAEELVKFLQPNTSSVVLNRILDQSASTIHGSIEANGHVILVNPRGVLFTESATINVGAITASGLDMSPEDFMNGNFTFKGEDGSAGFVVNKGVINAASAVLVGKQVTNASSGLISAELVSLAAADEAILTFDADGMIGVQVTKEVMENDLGVDSAVLNKGNIDGAQVLLEASVSGDLFTAAVNNEGTIKAQGIDTSGGKIRLFGSGSSVINSGALQAAGSTGGQVVLEGDTAEHSGAIDVRGSAGRGGQAMVLGDEVLVSGTIDARGTAAGGEALIGGDYQGKNSRIRNAKKTTVTEDAHIDASGLGESDGGEVIVWADHTTNFAGTILAESGKQGGDGGFVETSGKVYLNLGEDGMYVSTLSHGKGITGEWLLDPGWFDILDDSSEDVPDCISNCMSVGTLQDALTNNSVTVKTTSDNTANAAWNSGNESYSGDFTYGIRIRNNLSWSSNTTLTLDSHAGVMIHQDATVNAGGAGSLSILAKTDVINNGTIQGLVNFSVATDGSFINAASAVLNDSYFGSITAENIQIIAQGDIENNLDGDKAAEIVANKINLSAGGSFNNYGKINFSGVSDGQGAFEGDSFELKVGQKGEGSTNYLGKIYFDGASQATFNVLGGSGSDIFVLSDWQDEVFITGNNAFDLVSTSTNPDETNVNHLKLSFSSIENLNTGAGTDSIIDGTGQTGSQWILGSGNKEITGYNIAFSDVETIQADVGELVGRNDQDEIFTLSAYTDNGQQKTQIDTKGMAFTGIDILSAGDSSSFTDTINSSVNNRNWALTASDNQVEHADVIINDADIFSGGNGILQGASNSNDSYQIVKNADSTTAIQVDGMHFNGLTRVEAGAHAGVNTTDILIGTDEADTFGFLSGELHTYGISFTGIEEVNAGGTSNDGISDQLNTETDVNLTGNQEELRNANILFKDIEQVAFINNSNGKIVGSAIDDSFIIASTADKITANSIDFTGFNKTIDTGEGSDTVSTLVANSTWSLSNTDKEATSSGITFTNIEKVTASDNQGTLESKNDDNEFALTSDGRIDADAIRFTGFTTIEGNGTASLDASAISGNLLLLDDNNVKADFTDGNIIDITISGINEAVASNLLGADIAYTVKDTNKVFAKAITFSSVDRIVDTGSSGAVTSETSDQWELVSADNEVKHSGITFAGMRSLTGGNNTLVGAADNGDSYQLSLTGDITVDSMIFKGIRNVNANTDDTNYTDTVDATGAVTLQGNNAFGVTIDPNGSSYDINFSGIDAVTNTGILTGTTGADTFTVEGDNKLRSKGIQFLDVSSVLAGNDTNIADTVNAKAGETVALTGIAKELITSNILFKQIEIAGAGGENLVGSDSDDTIEITGDKAFKANEIAFTGIASLNTGAGTDSIIDGTGQTGSQWILGSGNKEVTGYNIAFSDVETIQADIGELVGRNDQDEIFTLSAYTDNGQQKTQIDTKGMAFTGIDILSAGDSSSFTDTINSSVNNRNWALTASDNQVEHADVIINDADIFSGGNGILQGASNSNDSYQIVKNADSTTAIQVDGMHFNGLTRVEAGAHAGVNTTDILIGTDEADTFGFLSGELHTYGISFTGIEEVNAGGTSNDGISDQLNTETDVNLTGNQEELRNANILFKDIEQVAFINNSNGKIVGSAIDDSFIIASTADKITANSIDFTGFNKTIDTGEGSDTVSTLVANSTWSLSNTDKEATSSGITFTNIEKVTASDNQGTLESKNDDNEFALTSDGRIDADAIRFTGFTTIEGNGTASLDASAISGNLLLLDDNNVKADFTDGNIIDITISGINEAVASNLLGADIAYTVKDTNKVFAKAITFSSVDRIVDTGSSGAVTSETSDQWELVSADNEVKHSGITFAGMRSLTGGNNTLVGAADNGDSYQLSLTGDITVDSMIFKGIRNVNANTDDTNYTDTVDATGAVTLQGNNAFGVTIDPNGSSYDINFSGIDAVTNTGILTGTTGADTFTVEGDNKLRSKGIQFSDVSSVLAGNDTNIADTVNAKAGETVALTGIAKELITSNILFKQIEIAGAGGENLVGSDSDDTIEITGDKAFKANEIAFTGIASLNTGAGTDSIIDGTGQTGSQWILGAGNKEITGYNIAFSDVETIQADIGELVGRNDQDEIFTLSAYTDNGQQKTQIDTKGMAFTGIDILSAGDSSSFTDTINSSVNNRNWALTASDNQVEHADVIINDADIFSGGNGILQGASNSNDSYQIVKNADSTTAIQVDGMHFNGLTRVEAGAHAGVNTTDILIGTDEADTFGFLSGELHTYGISFTGIEEVNAGGTSNDGISDQLNTETDVNLTGNQEELRNANILFKDIEQVAFINNSNGKIVGSAIDDSFIIASTGDKLTANNIDFTGFNKTIDTGEGTDTVSTLVANSTWSLSNTDKEATSSGITFTNIEKVTASDNQGTLESKNDDNEFALTSDGRIDADAIRFTGFTTIEGNGTASLDASAISGNLLLLDDNNVKADFTDGNIIDITISGINEAVASNLLGADIAYTVKDTNKVFAKAITFSGVDRIVDTGSSGAVTSETSDQWELVSADNEVKHSGITFAGMRSLTGGNNTLVGAADNGDSYQLSLTGDITVDSMIFKGIRNVNANTDDTNYTDTVDATGAVTLQGNNAFGVTIDPNGSSYDINFSGIDAVTNTGILTGTTGADTFTVEGDNKLRSKGIQFSDVSSVLAGNDTNIADTVNAKAGETVALTGIAKELITSNILFKQIEIAGAGGENLVGSDSDDTIEITGDKAFKANEIAFTGIASLNTGAGTDSIIDGTGQTGSQWILGAGNKEITGYNIAFSDVETIQADIGELVGRNDQDEIFTLSAYTDNGQQKTQIDTKGMAFTGIDILSAGDSSSFTDTINSSVNNRNWALTASDNQVEHADVIINDADIFSGGNGILQGASNSNDSYQIVKNADSTTAIQVDGMHFNGLTRVEAGAHAGVNTTDILIGTDEADTFGFLSGELHTYGISFTGIEEVNAGGTSNDGISDQLNTETDVNLTGNQEELRNANILFKDIEQVAFINNSNGKIVGSAIDDSFIIASTGDKLTANNIDFTGFNKTIDTGEGTDTVSTLVANSTWSLSNTDKEATSSGITFTNIEKVTASDNQGTLESKNDDNEFALTSDGRIDADAIRFTGFTTIEGNGTASLDASAISGNLLLLDDNNVKADFTDGNIIDITISGINEAVASNLLGADIAYTVKDTNKVFAKAITFSSVDRIVDTGSSGAVTSETSDQWELVSADNEVKHSGITFAGMRSLTGGNNTLVGAADNGDSYQLSLTGDITVDSMIFKGIRNVNANTDDTNYTDTVDATGAVTLQGNNAFGVTIDPNGSSYDINFSGIDAVTNTGILTGTTGADTFTVEGDNKLRSKGIQFLDVSSVLAGNDTNIADTVNAKAGETVALTGIAKELITSNILFKQIEIAGAGGENLVGSDSDDTIEITGDKAFKANEIAFTGIASLNTGAGTDSIIDGTGQTGSQWILGSGNKEVTGYNIAFSDVETIQADIGELVGRNDQDEIFTLSAYTDNGQQKTQIDTKGMAFTGIDILSAGDSSSFTDTINSSVNNRNWALTASDNQVEHADVIINDADIFSGGNGILQGASNSNDSYQIVKNADSTTAIQVDGMHFNGLTRVEAGAHAGVNTTDILIGTDEADTFGFLSGELHTYGISFTGIEEVNAGGTSNDGISDQLNTETDVNLTGNQEELRNANILFKDIEQVAFINNSNGKIVGSAIDDSFIIASTADKITANSIDFTGFNKTIDTGEGSDTVSTLVANSTWSLSNTDKEATSSGITFTNIEKVTASDNQGTLESKNDDNEFALTSDGRIDADAIRFTGFTTIEGNGTASLDASAISGNLLLLDDNNVKADFTDGNIIDITISGINEAVASNLLGADIAYTVKDTNKVFAKAITFSSVDRIVDTGSSGAVTSETSDQWELVSADNEVKHSGITFAGMRSLTGGNNTLVGAADNGDSYQLSLTGDITVDSMIFKGIRNVNANTDDTNYTDTVDATGAVTLQGNNAFGVTIDPNGSSYDINFSGIDAVTNTGILTGTTGADTFTVEGDNKLRSKGIQFSDVSSVLAGNDTNIADTVNAKAGETVALTGIAKELITSNILFKQIEIAGAGGENLVGSDSDDTIEITGDKAFKANEIAFTGIASLNTGAGTDSIIDGTGQTGSQWILGSGNKEVTGYNIAFSNVETIQADIGELVGRNDQDEIFTLSAYTDNGQQKTQIDTKGMAFTGIDILSAGDSSSFTDTINSSVNNRNWALTTSDNQVEHADVIINDADIFSGGNGILQGASNSNDSYQIVKNADSTTAIQVDGMHFNGLTRVEAGAHAGVNTSDILLGTNDKEIFTFNDSAELQVNGLTFTGLESVNALGGDDYVDAENYSNGLELTGIAGELRLYSQGLLFQDIEDAYTTTLYGTDNVDAFSIIENGNDNLVVASAIDFTGVTIVDALGGQDTLSVDEANLENGKINGIQFVNLSDIISSSIVIGASQEGDFYVLGDGLVSSDTDSQNPGYEFNFTGVTSVKTNGYARTVTGLLGHNWIINNANTATNNGITFFDVSYLIAKNAGLEGYSNLGWALTANDNEVSHAGIIIKNANLISGGGSTLTGKEGFADTYTFLDGGSQGQLVKVDDMQFAGLSTVAAGDGGDTVIGQAGQGWALTDNANEVEHGAITIQNAEFISGGISTLMGGDFADIYTFLDGGSQGQLVKVDNMQFAGLSTVAAAGGDDTVIGQAGQGWALTDNENEVEHGAITIQNAEFISGGISTLMGGDFADTYTFLDGGSQGQLVKVDNMQFAGLSTVAAAGGDDTVIGQAGQGWALTDNENEVEHGAITIQNAEFISGGISTLMGGDFADTYTFLDGGSLGQLVKVDNMQFAGLSTVAAGDGGDTVIGQAGQGWALTDNENEVEHGAITIQNAEFISGGISTLMGGDFADTYTFLDGGSQGQLVKVDNMQFAGLSTVVAAGGDDTVIGQAGQGWALTDNENEVEHGAITIQNAEFISGGISTLMGGGFADTYTFLDGGSQGQLVKVDNMQFAGLSTVAAAGGDDTVIGQAGQGWALTDNENEVEHGAITIQNAEFISGGISTLMGGGFADTYTFLDGGSQGQLVKVDNMQFAGLSTVAAAGGDDTVIGQAGQGWALTDNENEVEHGAITIQNAEFISGGISTLMGGDFADTYTFLDGGSQGQLVKVDNMQFAGLSTVAAAGGDDTVIGQAGQGWALTDNENEVEHGAITIQNAEFISGGISTLMGGDFADTYTFLDGGSQGQLVKVDNMQFAGLSTVAAAGGDDTVIGQAGQGWALTDNENEVEHGAITIQNAEFISGGISTLMGGDFADTYTFLDGGSLGQLVKVDNMQFAGLSTVAAGDGGDTVIGQAGQGWALTDNENEVEHGAITIQNAEFISGGISTLMGGDFADTYTFLDGGSQGQLVKVDNMQFAGLSTVAAAGGDDTVIGQAGQGWALTDNENEVEHGAITIQNAEFISGGISTLMGGDFADTYTFLDGGSLGQLVKVDNMQFAGLSTVAAGDGGDTVIGQAGQGWALTGNANEVEHGAITIQNAEFISGGISTLMGGDFADTYTFLDGGSQGQLVKVDNMQFAGLSTVVAAGGDDTVIGQAGQGWALTDNENEVEHGAITIQNAEFISGGISTLMGGGFADTYTFLDGGSQGQLVKVDNMQFAGLSTVAAAGGDDTVIGQAGQGWALTDNENEVEHGAITIQNAEFISGGISTLMGGDFADTYTFLDGGSQGQLVKVDNMQFAGLSTVAAAGGDDTVIGQAGQGWALTDNENEVEHGTITIQNAEFISGGISTLMGGDFADIYTFLDGGSQGQLVKVDNMQFAGLSTVAAAGGDDTVIGQAGQGWALTDNENEVEHGAITIQNAEFISGGISTLMGGGFADTYTFLDGGSQGQLVKVDNMQFAGLSTVAAAGGDDTVIGQAGQGWALTDNENEVEHGAITIQNAEFISGGISTLMGGDFADTYTFLDGGSQGQLVKVDNMQFAGLSTVAAAGGDDTVIGQAGQGWALTDNENEVEHGTITIQNAEFISGGISTLMGGDFADTYTFLDGGSQGQLVKVDNMQFAGLSTVAAAGGDDTVIGQAGQGWALTDNENEVEHGAITIQNAEFISGGISTLMGGDFADTYTFLDGGSQGQLVKVDNMQFAGLSTVAAAGGDDTVIGQAGQGWALTDNENEVEHGAITIQNAEFISGGISTLMGGDFADTYTFLDGGSLGQLVKVDNMQFAGLSTVAAAGGDDTVIGQAGQGWALTDNENEVEHGAITIQNAEFISGGISTLMGGDFADTYTFLDGGSQGQLVKVDNMQFAGLSTVAAAGGDDTVIGQAGQGWALTDNENEVEHGAITIQNAEFISGGISTLMGGDFADTYTFLDGGSLGQLVKVDNMQFAGLSTVAAGDGGDTVIGQAGQGWALTDNENEVEHGAITIQNAEFISGGISTLVGGEHTDTFSLSKSGADAIVRVDNMTFMELDSVDAGEGSDTIVATSDIAGETWVLGLGRGALAVAGVSFEGIEQVDADNVSLDASTNNQADTFELAKTGKSLKARGIEFSSVASVSAGSGNDDSDTIQSDAGSWQLAGTANALEVNGVQFSGIDHVETNNAQLYGTDADDVLALTESGIATAGIAFTGITKVSSEGGTDHLIGTSGKDTFVLASNGDITAAGILFTGLESVDTGEGEDTVNAASSGASWTSSSNGSSLENGAAQARVNGLTVLFDNLEMVQGVGTYIGQDIGSNYVFDSLNSMTVAGVTFADLESLSAGSGNDTIQGANIDAVWDINDAQSTVSGNNKKLVFSGIEAINAGSGQDTFNLNGGELASIDTGAGNDTVILSATTIDSISLGEGDDYVEVNENSSDTVALSGGSGSDSFQYNLAGDTWQVKSSGNKVGNFSFSDFEFLDNTSSNLTLETDFAFDFENGGVNSGSFNKSGVGLRFAGSGMRLGYDGSGDINVLSSATGTIGGSLKAKRADLVVSGDVNIESDVDVLAISTSGPDVDITVLAKDNLLIDEINAGRGNVQLASEGFGMLTAETYGDTHITAGNITLGTDTQLWSIIGSELVPLRMDALTNVAIVSVSYYEPEFIGQVPNFTSKGDELQSIAGAQASQGLRSAIQNGVEDFTQVDPAIFSAVKPYSSGVDAVNSPEMRLRSGELLPAAGLSGTDEEDPEFDARLEESQDVTVDYREQETLASINSGGR